ncbi:helix-turn-helix domain-containing protein [Haladaptatus caseinilyticus]|uniref:helix-turn-helix domain-containing protein n=1 Tax=Haladaptatus caseinilyticus TaxID=2993314 RepID=UPI00224ADCD0|nr:helix-turn-helix domain-containing protein [Haladaptatus caseinilyticus]
MSGTIVEVTVPREQFALAHTLAELETLTFDVEQMVATNQKSLMPLMWVDAPDRPTLETAFAADDSVAGYHMIADFETEYLYQLEWVDRIEHLIQILVDQEGTVLRATGRHSSWTFRLLFADREMAARTNEYCLEHGIDFEVTDIHDFTGHNGSRIGLTDCQQTALELAAARGYYTVPREVSADDLAEELGISPQALSERLRRAHGHLVHHVFGTGNEVSDSTDTAH